MDASQMEILKVRDFKVPRMISDQSHARGANFGNRRGFVSRLHKELSDQNVGASSNKFIVLRIMIGQ